jgi:hypothetical protein
VKSADKERLEVIRDWSIYYVIYHNNNNNNSNNDTTNVEPEMYDYTSNNCNHWNSNEKFKKKFGSSTRKTFDRFSTKDSYTWNITHNTESTAV